MSTENNKQKDQDMGSWNKLISHLTKDDKQDANANANAQQNTKSGVNATKTKNGKLVPSQVQESKSGVNATKTKNSKIMLSQVQDSNKENVKQNANAQQKTEIRVKKETSKLMLPLQVQDSNKENVKQNANAQQNTKVTESVKYKDIWIEMTEGEEAVNAVNTFNAVNADNAVSEAQKELFEVHAAVESVYKAEATKKEDSKLITSLNTVVDPKNLSTDPMPTSVKKKNDVVKGKENISPINPNQISKIIVCAACLALVYYFKRRYCVDCDSIAPNVETVLDFYCCNGYDKTLEKYGIIYDKKRDCLADEKSEKENIIRIIVIGHMQFKVCLIVRNNIYGETLLDDTFDRNRWLVLTSEPDGSAKTKSGKIISSENFKKLFDLIRPDKRNPEGKTHPNCMLLRSIEQVKNIVDLEDIKRCSNEGCYGFNWNAEALMTLSLMRGLNNIEKNLIPEAFKLQIELEKNRLKNKKDISEATGAFAKLLDLSVHNSIINHLRNLLDTFFTICRQARPVRQSFDNPDNLFNMGVIKNTINDWLRLLDENHVDLDDINECLSQVVKHSNLQIELYEYIRRVIKKRLSIILHPDKTNPEQKKIFEKIFCEINNHREEIKKFLIPEDITEDIQEDTPEDTPNHNLVRNFQAITAIYATTIARCIESDKNKKHLESTIECSYAEKCGAGKSHGSDRSDPCDENSGSDETNGSALVCWKDVENKIINNYPFKLLHLVRKAYKYNPEAIKDLVRYKEISLSKESEADISLAILLIASINGIHAKDLENQMNYLYNLVKRFPQANEEIFPIPGQTIVEISTITSIVIKCVTEVELGLRAKDEIRKEEEEKAALATSKYNEGAVEDDLSRYKKSQFKNTKLQDDCKRIIKENADRIFYLLKGGWFRDRSNIFLEFLTVVANFCSYKHKYEKIRFKVKEIIDKWVNYENKESPEKSFITELNKSLVDTLSELEFNSELLKMCKCIWCRLNEIQNKYENKNNPTKTAYGKSKRAREKESDNNNRMPLENELYYKLLSNNVWTIKIREKDMESSLTKEERDTSKIYGYHFKVISREDENNVMMCTVRISKPEDKSISDCAPSDACYILFDASSIEQTNSGIRCESLDGKEYVFKTTAANLHLGTSKFGGRVFTEKVKSKASKKQMKGFIKKGSGKFSIQIDTLQKHIRNRYAGHLLPLLGIVENGYITSIITGNGDNSIYSKIVNKLLKKFGYQGFNENSISVWDACKKDKLNTKQKNSGRYNNNRNREEIDIDFQKSISKEKKSLESTLKHLDEKEEVDQEEIDECRYRLTQIEDLMINPPSESTLVTRNTIHSGLRNINMTYNDREQIEQILRDEWKEWTNPDDRVDITASYEDLKSLLEEKSVGFIFAFDGQVACLEELKSAIDSYYVNKYFKERENKAAVAVSNKELNNFTEIENTDHQKKIKKEKKKRGEKRKKEERSLNTNVCKVK